MATQSTTVNLLLNKFTSIDLDGMENYTLMKRAETKFLMNYSQFVHFIEACDDRFFILEIDAKRTHHYSSRYFDTDQLKSYYDHHSGKVKRYKVRFRKYDSSAACFVEFKQKTAKGVTLKQRCVSTWKKELGQEDLSYLKTLQKSISFDKFKSSLSNDFDRITLLDKENSERMTFDLNLKFNHQGKVQDISKVVIVELKQEKKGISAFSNLLSKQGIKSTSFSKYCTGIALLNPKVKKNNFKKNLVKVGKWVE
jgi:hypothetical protein